MTATDELRKMLDERGVEWWPMHDIENGYYDDRDTEFVIDGKKYTAHEWGAKLTVYGVTPDQAIAATLSDSDATTTRQPDAGTCHNESVYPSKFFCCSECGISHIRNAAYVDMPNFCPNCGRKVVDE